MDTETCHKSESADNVVQASPSMSGWQSMCKDFKDSYLMRIHTAFWLLGLCNHFGGVIILSGAHDIVRGQDHHEVSTSGRPHRYGSAGGGGVNRSYGNETQCDDLECNQHSTAIVLLAHVVPALLMKLLAPHVTHLISFNIRVASCIVLCISSLLVVALVHERMLSLAGVVLMSLSMSLGEVTFLSMTAQFPVSAVSYWSSGTGASGVIGAWGYVLMRRHLSPRDSMLVCLVAPVLMGLTYWKILKLPTLSHGEAVVTIKANLDDDSSSDTMSVSSETSLDPKHTEVLWKSRRPLKSAPTSLRNRMLQLRVLLQYMVPLFFVYFAEYLINQGLYELMIWRTCIFIDPGEQYRWFQALYQFGVFISRSSSQILPINPIWLLSTLQLVNLGVLFIEVDKHIFPNIYIPFAFTFYEGLLGGACYANAFSRIHREVAPAQQEFSLGAASVADSLGIAVAGVTALPIHLHYCSMWARK
ncbi:battenin-like [Sycon ciliatum]|uniref:battenin-like n=1 Tax=Sycon ciliatum TaxID=27933 RepID=UPI0031F6E23C